VWQQVVVKGVALDATNTSGSTTAGTSNDSLHTIRQDNKGEGHEPDTHYIQAHQQLVS
jgi:hypothetical protein